MAGLLPHLTEAGQASAPAAFDSGHLMFLSSLKLLAVVA